MSYLVNDHSQQNPSFLTISIAQKWVHKLSNRLEVLGLWLAKHQQRKQLAQLESHQLKDLGLTNAQVNTEVSKPFWK